MSLSDGATLALVALAAVIPLAFVLVVALIRGYTISLHMRRPRRDRKRPRG
jgi:hypothetical protein